jgi:hypothetical protein
LRGNFQTKDLAVTIWGNLAEADTQKVATSGSNRPISDSRDSVKFNTVDVAIFFACAIVIQHDK